jgi:hypothetical protein
MIGQRRPDDDERSIAFWARVSISRCARLLLSLFDLRAAFFAFSVAADASGRIDDRVDSQPLPATSRARVAGGTTKSRAASTRGRTAVVTPPAAWPAAAFKCSRLSPSSDRTNST